MSYEISYAVVIFILLFEEYWLFAGLYRLPCTGQEEEFILDH